MKPRLTLPKLLRFTALGMWSLSFLSAASADVIVLENGNRIEAMSHEDRGKDGIAVEVSNTEGESSEIDIARDLIDRVIELPPQVYRNHRSGGAFKDLQEASEVVAEACVLVRRPGGLGSGFVIDPSGHIVTNAHVIEGSVQIEITVFRRKDKSLRREVYKNVKILAVNRQDDLALLKVEPDDVDYEFVHVPMGESLVLEAGDEIFAIGNPMGLERSVSKGIVSVPSRYLEGAGLFLQHTAAISPGNSGGPLFNSRGEVIGVNSRKVAAAAAEGLGFSIPATLVKLFLDHRDAYAFDPSQQNGGFIYPPPPTDRADSAKASPRKSKAASSKKERPAVK